MGRRVQGCLANIYTRCRPSYFQSSFSLRFHIRNERDGTNAGFVYLILKDAPVFKLFHEMPLCFNNSVFFAVCIYNIFFN